MHTLLRMAGLAKNIIGSNLLYPRFPYRVTFILTYKCNLKCQMCMIWKRDGYPELSLLEIERFFKKSNYFNWVNVSGGEIFLRDDIVEIFKTIFFNCKELVLFDFPTNGFLTNRIVDSVERMLCIKDLPPRIFITVSLDGPEDLHDKLRGTKGSWRKAVETFNKLKRIKYKRLNVFFGMTISSQNMATIDATIAILKHYIPGISYRDLHVNLSHYSEHYYQNEKSTAEDIKDAEICMASFMKKRGLALNPVAYLEKRYQGLVSEFIRTNKTPLPCKALSSSCFIDPRGEIFPCSIMNSPLGNIKDFDYDLIKLWLSPLACNLRKTIHDGLCPQCWTPCEAYQTILGNLL